MKKLLVISTLAASALAWAAGSVTGEVLAWRAGIHLRDGSGAAADKTNDLLVTTIEQAIPAGAA